MTHFSTTTVTAFSNGTYKDGTNVTSAAENIDAAIAKAVDQIEKADRKVTTLSIATFANNAYIGGVIATIGHTRRDDV